MYGPAEEIEKSYSSGKKRNKHLSKKMKSEHVTVGRTEVVGIKDRTANRISRLVIEKTDAESLRGFGRDHIK